MIWRLSPGLAAEKDLRYLSHILFVVCPFVTVSPRGTAYVFALCPKMPLDTVIPCEVQDAWRNGQFWIRLGRRSRGKAFECCWRQHLWSKERKGATILAVRLWQKERQSVWFGSCGKKRARADPLIAPQSQKLFKVIFVSLHCVLFTGGLGFGVSGKCLSFLFWKYFKLLAPMCLNLCFSNWDTFSYSPGEWNHVLEHTWSHRIPHIHGMWI